MSVSTFICAAVSAAVLLCSFGCKPQEKSVAVQMELPQEAEDHRWFYFSDGSFAEVDLPQYAPIHSLRPWTESIRVCDGNIDSAGTGLLLVNHLGILFFAGADVPVLAQDYQLLSNSTAGNLVFDGGNAYFTLVRNSFFNKNAAAESAVRNHVVRFSPAQRLFFPAVTYSDLQIAGDSEVSGTYFDGDHWFSSVKTIDASGSGKVSFRYIQWKPNMDMSALSPLPKPGKITISESSEDSYRNMNIPADFSSAPARLRALLSSIPDDFGFSVTCKDAGGASPRYFSQGTDTLLSSASAIIKENWICAVFGDGTVYFCGGLDGLPLINGGRTVAFRLPKLPLNYEYTDFCISGACLAVGWEETDFYKTGRSGFLTVDMKKLFYTE